ncbi:MAG: hypothetical protein ACYSTG_05760 [Planctomycetota bacterium]
MKLKTELLLVLGLIVGALAGLSYAENIDPNNDGSQYAYGENVGWVNFEPNVAGPNVGATVSEEKLTGFIWAENIGWINLDPNDDDPNTGVSNDGAGNLSGLAWGENVGWINFDPNVPGDPNHYGVTIDIDGNFDGLAWGENIGWINFNSADLYGFGVQACKVNFIDLANFVDDWLQSGPGLPGDLSGNEEVDFVDYGMFAQLWLTFCPDDWPLK